MSSRIIIAALALCLFVAAAAPDLLRLAAAEPRPAPVRAETVAIHMSPAENLERIDVATIDGAEHEIDFAAYVLADYPVIEALGRAADRGVTIRIVLDRGQHDGRDESPPLTTLRQKSGVEIRIKRSRVYMHLKAYQVDGRLLRTGSANFSASGLKRQENDLVLIEGRQPAARFREMFDGLFGAGATE